MKSIQMQDTSCNQNPSMFRAEGDMTAANLMSMMHGKHAQKVLGNGDPSQLQNDYFILETQEDNNESSRGKSMIGRSYIRQNSQEVHKTSKMSQEIMKDMKEIDKAKKKKNGRQMSDEVNRRRSYQDEDEEEEVIGFLTSQVMGQVLANECKIEQFAQYDQDGTASCEANSFDLKEGPKGRMARLKRAIDQEHQKNIVQKNYQTFVLKNYDDIVKQKDVSQVFDPTTGLPKIQQFQGKTDSISEKTSHNDKDQDQIERSQEKNEEEIGTMSQVKMQEQIQQNAQKYLAQLIKLDVAMQYNKTKERIEQEKEMEEKKKEKEMIGKKNKPWSVDSPYYRTTSIDEVPGLHTNKNSKSRRRKRIEIMIEGADQSVEQVNTANLKRTQKRLGYEFGMKQFTHLQLSPMKNQESFVQHIKKQVKRQLASTNQAAEALNFGDSGSMNAFNGFSLKKPLNVIIDEQEYEDDIDQFQERVNTDTTGNRRINGVIESQAAFALGRHITPKMQGNFKVSRVSRSHVQDVDDTLCDEIAVGQEDARVQTVRDSSWVSYREESVSNASTRSRGRSKKRKTKIELDENPYQISRKYRQVDIDDLEERASSNSVKRSLKKQQKWTDKKQVKITLVENSQATLSSEKQQASDHGIALLNQNVMTKEVMENMFQSTKLVSVLVDNSNKYQTSRQRIDKMKVDISKIAQIKQRFTSDRINCIKYNYSLDKEVQSYGAFHGYIQLSEDGQYLNIFNKKSIRKEHLVSNPDFNDIQQLRSKFQETLKRDKKTNIISGDNFVEGVDYVCKKSSSSTALKDIQSILFGGLSSRFWLFRKHVIQQNKVNIRDDKLPFYSWQCITLQLKHREVDLVIPDDHDMNDFLLILIDAMNTVNGMKGSAQPVIDNMHMQKYKKELKRQIELTKRSDMKKIKFLDKEIIWQNMALTPQELHSIKLTTLLKYKIMRVRAKISFMAFKSQKTVPEMIYDQIMKSFLEIAKQKENELGDLSDQFELFRMNDHAFQQLITDGMGNIFNRIMQLNVTELKQQDMLSYVKLKFQQAVDIIENHKDDETQQVRDKVSMRWKQVRIDELKNIQIALKNAHNLNKNRSSDIFLQMEKNGDNNSLLDKVNYRDLTRYKQQKYNITKAYQRLKIVINLKAVKGIMMLKALINKIKYAKQMFVLEIEQSKEAYIPHELSNDDLPCSFWYYDACLQQVQELIDTDKKQFASFKNQYRLNFYQRNDMKKKLMIRLGIIDAPNNIKLSLRHQKINEIDDNLILNHNELPTVMGLQRSRYVTIDEDVNRLQLYYQIQGRRLQNEMDKQINIKGCTHHVRLPKELREEAQMLILRYCPDYEITMKRKNLLIAKSAFLNKVDNYIEENIDDIYAQYIKHHPRQKKAKKDLYEVIMADELEKEDVYQAKKKLHSKMMDNIEHWLSVQCSKLRRKNVDEIRVKAGPNVPFHSKNHFIETDLEKHIKWFSKVRGFDIQSALTQKFNEVRKNKKEKMDQQLIKRLHAANKKGTDAENDLDAQLAMMMQIKDKESQEALQMQMRETLHEYNEQTIKILRAQIKEEEENVRQLAEQLDEMRVKQKNLLGINMSEYEGEGKSEPYMKTPFRQPESPYGKSQNTPFRRSEISNFVL